MPAAPQAEGHILRHAQVRKHGVILKHDPHTPLLGRQEGTLVDHCAASYLNAAGVRSIESGNQT